MIRRLLLLCSVAAALHSQVQSPDWAKTGEETLRHFSALVRINSTDPGGSEKPVVDYLKAVLDKEGIESKVFTRTNLADPSIVRPNLIARLKGNGKKKPLLIVGHTDTVNIDARKWTHGPFSAHREDGFIYGRGTLDNKNSVAAALMSIVLAKRQGLALDRDRIFLAEAGEEGNPAIGMAFLVNEHFQEVEAEYCLAEAGGVPRTGGKASYVAVQTTEKIPRGVRLIASGVAGHGSAPLRSNPVTHIAKAVAKVADWQPPMRLNETTRTYFERLAGISTPDNKERYNAIFNPEKSEAAQEYFAAQRPYLNSMLRTSISPNVIQGGYRFNVIPSEAEATLDIRALPDEDMDRFYETLKSIINDPAIKIVREIGSARPAAPPSALDNEAFRAIEAVAKRHYGVPVLPTMSTGATDMAFLRAKGVQCYGIGPAVDTEDGPKGFGAHSDQERILESALYQFVKFHYDLVVELAGAK